MTRHVRKFDKGDIRNYAHDKIRRELATRTFEGYLKYVNRNNLGYVIGRHIKYLCELLEKVMSGEIRRLAVFMPPQHGKSMTITETFAAYFLLKNPDKKVLIGSYGKMTADKFGEANLLKVIETAELFDLKLSKKSFGKKNFKLDGYAGELLSTTIRGAATSYRADLFIMDDPIKSLADLTKTNRDLIDNVYRTSFKTRLSPTAAEIMILTRWHNDDIAARVIDDTWTVVDLPAISLGSDVDLLGRERGEPLFPEVGRDLKFLEEMKRDLGTKSFEAMFQQNPRVDDGILIKREHINYYDREEFNMDFVEEFTQTWDLILKGGETSDYAVGQLWGRIGDKHYLIDMVRGQWTYKKTLEMFDEFVERHSDKKGTILIEDKMNGTNLLIDRAHVRGITAVGATINKAVRVETAAVEFEFGCVYLPEGENYSFVLTEEAVGFGSEKYDDAIDACAQYLNYYRGKKNDRKGYSKGGVAVSSGTGARKDLSVRNSNNALKQVGSKRGVFGRR